MRNATIFLMATALISLFAQTSNAQIAWETKLRDAHSKARQEGKLMLLHFYTDNCIYCDQLEAGAFRSESVCSAINDQFVPVKVHGGKNRDVAKWFKVTKFPTDVVVTTDGKALSHMVSPQQPDRYIAMLTGAKAAFNKSNTMLAAKQAQPESAPPTNTPTMGLPSQDEIAAARSRQQSPAAQTQTAEISMPSESALAASPQSQPRTNQFVMPGGEQLGTSHENEEIKPHAVDASLASARREPESMKTPELSDKPELAIEGFCPVAVVKKGEWVEGQPDLGVVHLGKLYLFADRESMELFLADPTPFTPMLNEIDVVKFFEEKKIVAGKREWGLIDPIHNRMFFFSNEETMLHFEEHFQRYVDASIEVMDFAIEEANPGV